MHLVNTERRFSRSTNELVWRQPEMQIQKKRVKFVAIFPFYFIYFHYPLKFRHRFAQYSEDTNCKVISAIKFHVPTIIQK